LGPERGEALELGVLILLEKLSPAERAAYILREAFDYAYRDIADTLRLQEANARQLVTRARQHVAKGWRRPADSTEQRGLLAAFIVAARNGDVAGLEGLVASRVLSTSERGLRSSSPSYPRASGHRRGAIARRPGADWVASARAVRNRVETGG
jgi:Sigma-70, region 4